MMTMRTFAAAATLLLTLSASAATLHVEVSRNGFTGPLEIAVAPRIEGPALQWAARKTLAAGRSSVAFPDMAPGLYVVLASGPQPLQRLSARPNLGSGGGTVHLAIPKTETAVHVTLAGKPLPRATVALNHHELQWRTDLETDEQGRFAGAVWEPGRYWASVSRGRGSAPHYTQVTLSPGPLTIDVPDRHVSGRVLTEEGKPITGAQVDLRSETEESTRNIRTASGADGRFEFLGVREGAFTLTAVAPSRLHSDAAMFDLRGTTHHTADLVLTRGEPRAVRVVDARDAAIAGATLFTACGGHVKSTAVTSADGRAEVAVPASGSCTIYVLPKEGSIAAARFEGPSPLLVRVPDGASSLRLALQSEGGTVFDGLMLLMRMDGTIVPPEIARRLASQGFSLTTGDDGTVTLTRIPPGTYEFWPYRTAPEGQTIHDAAAELKAPISIEVLAGENNATVRFKAR
jgi:Carboxypeptidase regulatory-like domain